MVIGVTLQKEETALVRAAKNRNLAQVSVNVAQNISASAQALDSTTSLMVTTGRGYAKNKISFIIRNKDADVNYMRKKFGATALMLAATYG
ncbi:MAG: ankyrin repeat domain-containing protein [Trichodesmium sp. MAG_R03]|nr:ankyrin repeat domain-containing protein [Trichodesmium sp. MAG_R03]